MKIAVIGGGIAGMASAWLLQQRHQVVLLEANDYIGGHTNTVTVPTEHGDLAVDTGFIVFNEPNYPNLTALLNTLGVETRAGDMSFAASLDNGRVEYGSTGLQALMAGNLVSLSHYRMLADVPRFNRAARRLIENGRHDAQTLGAFLEQHRLGREFRERYLLPMAAAIWSCPPAQMLEFPALSLARFFANHGLIKLKNRPRWRTLVGGSRSYVQKLFASSEIETRPGNAVTRVERQAGQVRIHTRTGEPETFDQVVLACHADQALALLANPSPREQAFLSRFRYQPNRAWLHTDPALMPKRRATWSSWNYLARSESAEQAADVSVTYWMNRLQGLPGETDYFVTLNPITEPAPDRVIATFDYEHPVFDREAMAIQPWLASLQGQQATWYAGSYFGYGFHEDALKSAIAVAEAFGIRPSWADQAETSRQRVAAPCYAGFKPVRAGQ